MAMRIDRRAVPVPRDKAERGSTVSAPAFLGARKAVPAIFLDKDGTVLQDVPYNVDPAQMMFAPGAREGIERLARLRLPLIVVTNQPGIALRKFDFKALAGMKQRLRQMFQEAGAALDGIYVCPHHPDGSLAAYARSCACRKPAPGLLLAAARQHHIDLPRSWFIGDILDDVEAGRRAGCRTVLIDNGNETEWIMNARRRPDHCVADLAEAGRFLVEWIGESEEALP